MDTGIKSMLRNLQDSWAVFSYKLRYIVGVWLVDMVISTTPKLLAG